MALNQEALTDQMQQLAAGAIATPGTRGVKEAGAFGTEIDVEGGAGVLEGGIKPLGGKKKKEEHIQATSTEDLLAGLLEDLDPTSNIQDLALDTADFTNNLPSTDDEIVFHAKDLGTLGGDPEVGGFIRTSPLSTSTLDTGVRDTTDLSLTDSALGVIDDFAEVGSEPFQISSDFSRETKQAADFFQDVAFDTAFRGQDLSTTLEKSVQNFVLNKGILGDANQIKRIAETFDNVPSGGIGKTLGLTSAGLDALSFFGKKSRQIQDAKNI